MSLINIEHPINLEIIAFPSVTHRLKRAIECASPNERSGGVGKYGFNSYNLLTFAILSFNVVSNIISNVNNNANNNNNNDNLYNFGSTNVAESSTSADNTNKNMLMITVPPAGPPVVVPTGKLLFNGSIVLDKELEEPGVSWYFPKYGWTVFDNGTIIYNNTWKERGLVSFGVLDDQNTFHPLKGDDNKSINWENLRSSRHRKEKSNREEFSKQSTQIHIHNFTINLPANAMDVIYNDLATDIDSIALVMTAHSGIGPPIVVQIGFVLVDGEVLLNKGVEVEGVYWKSSDRTLFENGTIQYHTMDEMFDKSEIVFGTISANGTISPLPYIDGKKIDLKILRKLNIRHIFKDQTAIGNTIGKEQFLFDTLKASIASILSSVQKKSQTKRSPRRPLDLRYYLTHINFMYSFSSLMSELIDNGLVLEKSLEHVACNILRVKELEVLLLNDDFHHKKKNKILCYIKRIKSICKYYE